MPVQTHLKANGLSTFSNNLELSEGALLVADNVVIDKPNVIEQRRGLSEYGTSLPNASDRAKQLMVYKGRIIRHVDSILQYDSDSAGTFNTFNGSYIETIPGLRIKSSESNGNFYFTTNDGIKKISVTGANDFSTASGFILKAGGPKALDLNLSLSTTAAGFLPPDSKVAYRVVWGTKDANNNLILGAPSERVVISYDLLDTFIPNINDLLLKLDASTGPLLNYQDYYQTLRLNDDSTSFDVYTNLTQLASKIDNDIKITDAVSVTAIDISTTGSNANLVLTFNNSVENYLISGDKVQLSNFSTSGTTGLNNTTENPSWTILSTNGSSAFLSVTSNNLVSLSAGFGTPVINSYNFRAISAPSEPSNPATYADNQSLKTYFNSIVNQLQLSPSTWIASEFQPMGSVATEGVEVRATFSIPTDINSNNYQNYFYQLYRTEVSTSEGLPGGLADVNPGDEMALVIEDNPTLDQVNSSTVNVIDNTPDSFRGLNLYTNEISGELISQANDIPPIATDLALFKNCMFYSNTRSYHQRSLTLLGTNNLVYTVPLSASSISVSSNVGTIQYPSPISGISANDIITMVGYSGNSVSVNGTHEVISVSGNSLTFSITASDFTDSVSADLQGNVLKSGKITFNKGSDAEDYYFVPSSLETSQIVFNAASTLATSGNSDYFLLNSANDVNQYAVYYKQNTSVEPAVTGVNFIQIPLIGTETDIEVATKTINIISALADFNSSNTVSNGATGTIQVVSSGETTNTSDVNTGFTFTTINNGTGENPQLGYVSWVSTGTPGQNIEDISKSLVKVVNQRPNGLFNGYYISTEGTTPGKMSFSSRALDEIPFYLTADSTSVGESFDPTLPTSGSSIVSDNNVQPNGLYFSKTRQPEAVPSVNFFPVGPKDKAIQRILALRDSLFILKQDGIYRVSGDGPGNFAVFLFDTSAKILAPDSAVVLNNQIYMWSDQGVVTVTDTGVSILSRDIEDQLNRLVNFSSYNTASFGTAYDLDRAYLFWTVSKDSDTTATQCFRYNFLTQAWTRWPISKTCGIVNQQDNKLYVGSGLRPYIEKERKALDRTDFCDRQFNVNLGNNSTNGTRLVLNDLTDVNVYDVVGQTQYLTIADLTILLKKLDLDPATSLSDNYYSSVSAKPGDNMRDKLVILADKLDNDLAVTTFSNLPAVTSASNSSPSTLQNAYNSISNVLNSSSAVTFDNYPSVTGTTLYESLIISTKSNEVSINTDIALPVIVGPVTIYKHYSSTVEYAPNTFGSPATLKQVREATYLFKFDNFKSATFAYATDLSPQFDTIDYNNLENGTFGNYIYGQNYYGGGGQSTPLRVLIPQQKQRCTFIRAKFIHNNARELYQLYGLTMTVEQNAVDARAYR